VLPLLVLDDGARHRLTTGALHANRRLTINVPVPVVYMGRDEMILMWATFIEGHWNGWALKVETFLGSKWPRAKRVPFGPKKAENRDVKSALDRHRDIKFFT
jgi:hypothetical protein